MIDEKNKLIYADYSTLSTFDSCKEKARLQSVAGWRPDRSDNKLTFGHAFHAGVGAYFDALAGGYHNAAGLWVSYHPKDEIKPLVEACAAFVRDLGYTNATLPTEMESDERRSIERGMGLLAAYIDKWKEDQYDNILNPDGSPCVEVGFRYLLGHYEGYDIFYVGYIDRLMRSRRTGRPTIFETKTTTMGLSQYVEQSKPNHQVTGYFPAAIKHLAGEAIREAIWDCIFVSDRAPNYAKAAVDHHWLYGINIEADFARQPTTRSATDITEFLEDAENRALEYAKWLMSGTTRWPRSAPTACHMYGGCQFRNRCRMNLTPDQETQFMRSTGFKIEKWEPWRAIVERMISNG